jgi:acetolactate synthase-1/2/3 large subunit
MEFGAQAPPSYRSTIGRFMPDLTDLVVSRLRDLGVGAIFGVPGGGGNLDLVEAAGRAGLPFVLTSTETGAAIAAMAQAEVTGRPGACLATLGPGAASLANGVACAYLDRAPVLVFTDSHPLAAGGAYTHQQLDHRALFAPITRWSGRLTGGDAAGTIDEAVRALFAGPPGPVHLDWPGDATAGGRETTRPVIAPAADPAASPASALGQRAARESLAALVSAARKPIVIVGLGARAAGDAAAIRALCERRCLPALVTYKAKGVVPDEHACFAGVFTNAAIERPIVEQSDLILGIGLDPVELLPRPWPYQQPAAYVGPWRVSDSQVPFAMQHVTHVTSGVREIDGWLSDATWDLAGLARERDRQRRLVDVPADGLTAQRVVQLAAERFAPERRVTVDAGAHMVPATMMWPVGEPNGMLISNGLSTMGFALPAAIGAALADRGRGVVALTGDGGLLMCVSELATAARERLPIVTIVFADGSLSLIEIKQQRRQYRPSGVALGPVNWPDLARGFGVAPFAARDEAELARALDQAASCPGPSLIEARIDRTNYARTFQAVRA